MSLDRWLEALGVLRMKNKQSGHYSKDNVKQEESSCKIKIASAIEIYQSTCCSQEDDITKLSGKQRRKRSISWT